MKTATKIFFLVLYWFLSIELIQWLINYPEDITFYGALIFLFANCILTIYLLKIIFKPKTKTL